MTPASIKNLAVPLTVVVSMLIVTVTGAFWFSDVVHRLEGIEGAIDRLEAAFKGHEDAAVSRFELNMWAQLMEAKNEGLGIVVPKLSDGGH